MKEQERQDKKAWDWLVLNNFSGSQGVGALLNCLVSGPGVFTAGESGSGSPECKTSIKGVLGVWVLD